MTLGGSELQVFVTFLVILACAFVALLMDYLKGNNEQLRERHVDLLVRQEQYAAKSGFDATVLARSLEQVLGQQTAALKEIVAESIDKLPQRDLTQRDNTQRDLEEARNRGTYVSSLQDLPVWEIPEPKREAPSADIPDADKVKISLVAETDVKPAEPTPAPQAEAEIQEDLSEPAPPAHDFDRFLDDLVTEFEQNPSAYPAPPELFHPEPPSNSPIEEAIPLADPSQQLVPLAAALESHAPELPSGLIPAAALTELLASSTFLNGVVVCVGINDYSQLHKNLGKATADKLLGGVDALMSELLRGKSILCRRAEDEFILIDPETSGAFAQRRLNDISERLWDFQLRNLGNFSVVFTWGAHEAQGELLRDAVEAAQEKMHETQAARKSSSFDKLRRRLATA
jgi:GGDEF domain-containing protein